MVSLVKKLFGSRNERVLRQHFKQVDKINALELVMQKLTDAELQAKTVEFKARLAQGETLNQLLPEAFAVVREASVRTLGLRHFDVQLIGGMVLNNGNIAEMLTGEGKTLVATLPSYLNALTGKGVHIVTVNDYLAKRDASWMDPIYQFLGMTTGVNVAGMSHQEKQQAYNADITFGTNNEFGFDYLRDNMAFSMAERVQRELAFAVVDEVDSILIDEARTPLIISGPAEDSSELYRSINQLIPNLQKQIEEDGPGDFSLDEKAKQAYLTEDGHQKVEQALVREGLLTEGESLYDANNIMLMHHVNAALRAHTLFQKDVDYIVRGGEIVIVDEHTGRLMQGRRWSDGLHQAIEAKENATIQHENQTLASITFQNYFRLYDKLSGMTGTADTEAYEFQQIYALEVVVIPPNKPVSRKDYPDKVFITTREKFLAIIEEIKLCQKNKQPVLVGTTSIENSELIAKLLRQEKIPHEILNAKQHEREAHIIAQAGRPGAVTIATNMAGRGTDIVLGGNLKAELAELDNPTEQQIKNATEAWHERHRQVLEAGGLHVLGTERHESRRIDNQLRGRSGRQGDPGSSRFHLALDDPLLRIFASNRLGGLMQKLGVKEGEALESSILSKVIENAQRKVEGHNFDIRKQLLEYDNVANEQRKVIYSQRAEIMQADDISSTVQAMLSAVATEVLHNYIPPQSFVEQWDIKGLQQALQQDFAVSVSIDKLLEENENLPETVIAESVEQAIVEQYSRKETELTESTMRQLEKSILLHCVDMHWKEHLATMDHLRQGIHLRGYAQKNPKQEYKREAFNLFKSMLGAIQYEAIGLLCRVQTQSAEQLVAADAARTTPDPSQMIYQHGDEASESMEQPQAFLANNDQQPQTRANPKVRRNEPCPCGSGKKFKHCHGKL